jgi:hypothetical protein
MSQDLVFRFRDILKSTLVLMSPSGGVHSGGLIVSIFRRPRSYTR